MLRYSAYPTIPSKAEITISMIGETLFFNIFFCPKYTVQRIAVMMTALMLIFSKELSYKFLKIIHCTCKTYSISRKQNRATAFFYLVQNLLNDIL